MKRKYLILSIILLVLIGLGAGVYIVHPYFKPLEAKVAYYNYKETEYSKGVLKFLKNHLSREDGAIYTNYLDTKSQGDETRGHDILSESQGLLMEYALMINNKEMFDEAYNVVKKDMMLKNGLVSWRITKDNEKNETSALIDEFRIARCLVEAYARYDEFKYKVEAIKLSNAMLEHSTYNGMISDFNDGINKAPILTLCYIDTEAFKVLKYVDESWNKIAVDGKAILKKGYVSDKMPFYRKKFNLEKKSYLDDKENENELLYSLMVWENEIKNGKDPKPINDWMYKQLKKYGCLYTKYNMTTNEPTKDYIESTSIYAVAYRISLKSNNKELQEKLYKSLMKYYMKEGELKGGFGMEKSKQAFSFDNIEAMMSLTKKEKKEIEKVSK